MSTKQKLQQIENLITELLPRNDLTLVKVGNKITWHVQDQKVRLICERAGDLQATVFVDLVTAGFLVQARVAVWKETSDGRYFVLQMPS